MKKRFRKKKHFAEFKEIGFEVRGDLRPGLSGNDIEAFKEKASTSWRAPTDGTRRAKPRHPEPSDAVERLPHLPDQIDRRDRLGEEVGPRFEHAVVEDRVVGLAGHV
jgi:hypothetical protein